VAVPLQPVAVLPRPGQTPVISAYREYRPAPAVTRPVACTWQGVPGQPRRMRLLPDGCLDLVWDGQHVRAVRPAGRQVRHPVGETALVIGLRIRPGWAAAVLGTPVGELPGIADLADLWDPATTNGLQAALAQAATPAAGRAVLTETVIARLARSVGPDRRVLAAVTQLAQPRAILADAARHAGLSSRQLRRCFEDHVGLPPKTLQTILRFQRFRAWLAGSSAKVTLAFAAAECGYFDQAHACRDCARLAGTTPAVLLAASAGRHRSATPVSANQARPIVAQGRSGSWTHTQP
jgi:AraC-like DNA-binding protein